MLTHMEGAHFLHMLTHMAGLLRSSSIWSRRTPSLGWGPPTPPYAYTYGEEATPYLDGSVGGGGYHPPATLQMLRRT